MELPEGSKELKYAEHIFGWLANKIRKYHRMQNDHNIYLPDLKKGNYRKDMRKAKLEMPKMSLRVLSALIP